MPSSPSVSRRYSEFNPVVLEKRGRLKIARQILNVLKQELRGMDLKELKVLDVGCSSGIITNYLSDYFGSVEGIDNDLDSIKIANKDFKKKNLHFSVGNALEMKFRSGFFDVVIANQIYYCFDKPKLFLSELKRVLKKDGFVFFGARNKYTLWDAQYHLPLLAFMPKFLANFIVNVFGRADKFNANYMDYWELEKLCSGFRIEKLTPKIIKNPNIYGFKSIAKFGWLTGIPSLSFWIFSEPILPNFIWILRKK